MPSQIELLKDAIARLEAKGGPESPYLTGLKTQLVGLESQSNRAQEREQFNLAVNSRQQTAPVQPAMDQVVKQVVESLPKEQLPPNVQNFLEEKLPSVLANLPNLPAAGSTPSA